MDMETAGGCPVHCTEATMELTQYQIDYCMECGVCTASCPISYERPSFSPRQMIKRAMLEPEGDLLAGDDIWACLSCSRCSDRCPVGIDFPEFIRTLRMKARKQGNLPRKSHHGVFQTLTEIQSRMPLSTRQQRTTWAEGAGTFRQKGDLLYFVGCLPYYDIVFQYLEMNAIESARSLLKLFNRMGVEPVISNDEKCCGHDAWWTGREETFQKLAEANMAMIEAAGAKTVVFGCPEGYITFRDCYPQVVGELPFEIIHVSEYLARELPGSGVTFSCDEKAAVTYQDPCRLGRRAGIYDAPRELIRMVQGADLAEMPNHRENAICCGTSAWMECSSCSKVQQTNRLAEAQGTGAAALVTACDKCKIHFTCARSSTDMKLGVVDLYTWLAGCMVDE